MHLAIMGRGTMGQIVKDMAMEHPDIEDVSIIEPTDGESLFDLDIKPDVVIDFSHPDVLEDICDYLSLQDGKVGVVFATTGYSKADEQKISALSEVTPVIKSYNYSYGINTLKKLLQLAVPLLEDRSDIEIIEKHHRLKVDSPSGTALMLAEICDPEGKRIRCYGRQGEELRRSSEIGMHSIRGGTIFGEHTVLFALRDEVIEIKHTAFSKNIFAKGAIEAALWLEGKKAGIYPLEEVFY